MANWGCGHCGRPLPPPDDRYSVSFWSCTAECYLSWFWLHFYTRYVK